jgi:hypothetical protein
MATSARPASLAGRDLSTGTALTPAERRSVDASALAQARRDRPQVDYLWLHMMFWRMPFGQPTSQTIVGGWGSPPCNPLLSGSMEEPRMTMAEFLMRGGRVF